MRLSKIQTGQICRARSCQYDHIKIFNSGPLTQKLLCIYCIFVVGRHELYHPKPIVHYELSSLLSLAHTLNSRDPQRDQSGLATSQRADQRSIQHESTDSHWIEVRTDRLYSLHHHGR